MTTYSEIIAAINAMLEEAYPEIRRYGNATVDQAIPPYFYVECIPRGIRRETRNMMHKGCTVKVTYVQRVQNDVDALDKAEVICRMLGMALHVGRRKLLVLDYGHEHVGKNNDILQASFRLDWYEDTEQGPKEELATDITTEMIQKGEP